MLESILPCKAAINPKPLWLVQRAHIIQGRLGSSGTPKGGFYFIVQFLNDTNFICVCPIFTEMFINKKVKVKIDSPCPNFPKW